MDSLINFKLPDTSNTAHETHWCRTCNNLASYSCFDEDANHLISTLAEALKLIKQDIDGNLASAKCNLLVEQTIFDKVDGEALQTKIDKLDVLMNDLYTIVKAKKAYLELLQQEKENKVTQLNNFKVEMASVEAQKESVSNVTTELKNGSITVSLIGRLQRLTAMFRRANYVALNAHLVGTFPAEQNMASPENLNETMTGLASIINEKWF